MVYDHKKQYAWILPAKTGTSSIVTIIQQGGGWSKTTPRGKHALPLGPPPKGYKLIMSVRHPVSRACSYWRWIQVRRGPVDRHACKHIDSFDTFTRWLVGNYKIPPFKGCTGKGEGWKHIVGMDGHPATCSWMEDFSPVHIYRYVRLENLVEDMQDLGYSMHTVPHEKETLGPITPTPEQEQRIRQWGAEDIRRYYPDDE